MPRSVFSGPDVPSTGCFSKRILCLENKACLRSTTPEQTVSAPHQSRPQRHGCYLRNATYHKRAKRSWRLLVAGIESPGSNRRSDSKWSRHHQILQPHTKTLNSGTNVPRRLRTDTYHLILCSRYRRKYSLTYFLFYLTVSSCRPSYLNSSSP